MPTPSNHSKTKPLSAGKEQLKRRCSCKQTMNAQEKAQGENTAILPENGIRFHCGSCNQTTWVPDITTILFALTSGLLVAVGIIFWVANGLFSFVTYSYAESFWLGLLSSLLIPLAGLLGWGAWINISRGITLLGIRIKHPVTEGHSSFLPFAITMLLGLVPWILAIGIGFLNDLYFNFGEGIAILLLPIIFSPIFLAEKLGSSAGGVFFSTAFWLLSFGIVMWLW